MLHAIWGSITFTVNTSLPLTHKHKYTCTHTQHSIIDEPIDYGVGIIASTDNWSVKIMSATKNLHTRSVIYLLALATTLLMTPTLLRVGDGSIFLL